MPPVPLRNSFYLRFDFFVWNLDEFVITEISLCAIFLLLRFQLLLCLGSTVKYFRLSTNTWNQFIRFHILSSRLEKKNENKSRFSEWKRCERQGEKHIKLKRNENIHIKREVRFLCHVLYGLLKIVLRRLTTQWNVKNCSAAIETAWKKWIWNWV